MSSSTAKPTVLSIYCKHKAGGFTKRLYRAWQAIAASDCELIYIATSELPVSGEGIHAVILPMWNSEKSPLYWLEFYLRSVLTLRCLSKKHQVKTHFVFSCFYATASIVSSIGLNLKTITLVRGDDVFDAQYKSFPALRASVHKALEKIAVRYSARVLATSNSMQQAMQHRNPTARNLGTLPNDITTSALDIKSPDINDRSLPVKIATVSVLNERKNITLALKALAQLKHLNWEYMLVGPDTSGKNHKQTLQRMCEEFGIAERVKFLGWQSDASQTLRDCHLFIFPTLMEGSPNALMEAMGYGLPCLASRIPEVTEVLTSSQLHFDPHDPAELAQKLNAFITDHSYAVQVAEQTTKDKQDYQFDWDQCIVELVTRQTANPEAVASATAA